MSNETNIYRGRYVRSDRHEAKLVAHLNRDRPVRYAAHMAVPELQILIGSVRTMSEYQAARTVLMTDDGVASAMQYAVAENGKECYFLDPHDGLVLRHTRHTLPVPSLVAPYNFLPFDELPRFDIFLTGCYGAYQGYVYTDSKPMLKAFKRLQKARCVTAQTCRVVLANQYQYGHKAPFNLCLTRANRVIAPGYGVESIWTPQPSDECDD